VDLEAQINNDLRQPFSVILAVAFFAPLRLCERQVMFMIFFAPFASCARKKTCLPLI
jgi:hypothetical protein